VALVSSAYFSKKLEICNKAPWRYVLSPAPEALATIRELSEPEDELILKIWTLARLNYDESTLLEGIELLRRVGWTTNSTEQGHSASSIVLRFHRACGTTMQIRGVLHQCRALATSTSEEKCLVRAEAKLRRLQAKNPNKIGVKAALVGKLLDVSARGVFAATHNHPRRCQERLCLADPFEGPAGRVRQEGSCLAGGEAGLA